MTLAIKLTQDPTASMPWCEAVDGLPLVEHFDGEPSIEAWLKTLWGVRSGQSSPRPVDGSWRWGWNALRRQDDRDDPQEAKSWAMRGSRS